MLKKQLVTTPRCCRCWDSELSARIEPFMSSVQTSLLGRIKNMNERRTEACATLASDHCKVEALQTTAGTLLLWYALVYVAHNQIWITGRWNIYKSTTPSVSVLKRLG